MAQQKEARVIRNANVITKADLDDLMEGYSVMMDTENGFRAMLTMTRDFGDEVYTAKTFEPNGRKIQEKTFRSIESADTFIEGLIKRGFRKLDYIKFILK
jgi:hypothetical protein